MIQRGILDRVTVTPLGTFLTATAAVSAATLTVDWTVEFAEDGGLLTLNDVTLAYVAADEDASTLTLAVPLALAAAIGDQVLSLSDAEESRSTLVAHVQLDEGEEAIPHRVDTSLEGRITEETPAGTPVLVDTTTGMVVGRDDIETMMDGANVWNPYVFRRATALTVPHTTWTTITGWADAVTQGLVVESNSSITVIYPGFYVIDASPTFSSNATGSRGARIMVNGVQGGYLSIPADSTGSTDAPVSCRRVLAEGDNITIQVSQTSGAGLALTVGVGVSPFAMYRVSV